MLDVLVAEVVLHIRVPLVMMVNQLCAV